MYVILEITEVQVPTLQHTKFTSTVRTRMFSTSVWKHRHWWSGLCRGI